MKTLNERVNERFERLFEDGRRVVSSITRPDGRAEMADEHLAAAWFAGCRQTLSDVYGDDSHLFKQFEKHSDCHWPNAHFVLRSWGVFEEAYHVFKSGGLIKVRQHIQSEVLSDLLEQAKSLDKEPEVAVSAVIAGCVLEDALRRLCTQRGISTDEKPSLEFMNVGLRKAGVYTQPTQQLITGYASIRNKAAHGQWTGHFTRDDVLDMIRFLERFLETHFT